MMFLGWDDFNRGVKVCKVFTNEEAKGLTIGFFSLTYPRNFFLNSMIDRFYVLSTWLRSCLNYGYKNEKNLSLFCSSDVSSGSTVRPYLSFSVKYFYCIQI